MLSAPNGRRWASRSTLLIVLLIIGGCGTAPPSAPRPVLVGAAVPATAAKGAGSAGVAPSQALSAATSAVASTLPVLMYRPERSRRDTPSSPFMDHGFYWQQSTFPGAMPLQPLAVTVQDANQKAVAGVTVQFTADPGVQILPTTAVSGPAGLARALVSVPAVPFSRFDITATSSAGATLFTVFTGPRLVRVFGDLSVGRGVVMADGTFLSGVDPFMIRPDGTSMRLGVAHGGIGLYGGSIVLGPDQTVYDSSLSPGAYLVMDSHLNPLRFLDMGAMYPRQSFGGSCADAQGNLYGPGFGELDIISPSGLVTVGDLYGNFLTQPFSQALGCTINSLGNLVEFWSTSANGPEFEEHDATGKVVLVQPIAVSHPYSMAVGPQGRYAIYNGDSVYVFDQQYNLVRRIQPLDPSQWLDSPQGRVGMDAEDNFYLWLQQDASQSGPWYLSRWDAQGHLLWTLANHGPYGDMAVEPSTGTLVVRSGKQNSSFVDGVYVGSSPVPPPPPLLASPGYGLAINSKGERYTLTFDLYGTCQAPNFAHIGICVYDNSGKILRTIPLPQVTSPSTITIDAQDRKYVVDKATGSIHVLDASDQYVGVIPVDLPSGMFPLAAGKVALFPDGTLLVFISGNAATAFPNPDCIKRIRPDGSEIWSVNTGNGYYVVPPAPPGRVLNVAVDDLGLVYLYHGTSIEVWTPYGAILGRADFAIPYSGGQVPFPMTSFGSEVYFGVGGRIYEVSAR